ncbi:hypothetical protein GMOD_00007149 [Pyrenophora seminiperda CCB06]|uniref:Uncharacterized protein n=1 Tax=Pyrenophora seminiperda CCB06 TaxID=1302712 RepID=A0A3M7MCB4_9PLEO|nr:hypothetical protein GMOD_00007149 [Pyrenophora seminiperda CCB06]
MNPGQDTKVHKKKPKHTKAERQIRKAERHMRKDMNDLVALFESGKIDLAEEDLVTGGVEKLLGELGLHDKKRKNTKSRPRHRRRQERTEEEEEAKASDEQQLLPGDMYECRFCQKIYSREGTHPHKKRNQGICIECDMAQLNTNPHRGKAIFTRSSRRVRFCLVCGHPVCQMRQRAWVTYCGCIAALLPDGEPTKSQVAAEVERKAAYEICKRLNVMDPESLPTFKSIFKLESTPLFQPESGSEGARQKAITQQILKESSFDMYTNPPAHEPRWDRSAKRGKWY